ncbi:MAG: oxidoreductase C-terminal domain-containing protein, partial [Pseudomonadota bacterium]
VELAADAGLACSNGIDVDEYGATADPDVYACGDCAHGTNRLFASPLRLESVQNANDQGLCVAKAIAGDRKPYAAVPWFWSDQYDVKLQIAGLSQGYTSTQLRGDPDAGRSFALFYLDGDRLLAVDAINRPREFVAARQLLAADAAFDARKLADESIPLNECRR